MAGAVPRWKGNPCFGGTGAGASGYRIKEMREELNCSERYVYEVFIRDVGVPPKLRLRWERMVMARRMLGGGMDAYDVAYKLGFCTPGCFGREFSALHGMSPGRFVGRLGFGEGVGVPLGYRLSNVEGLSPVS